ncbi:MAG: bifunctional 2-polyprenyl-6-hydroxyphenol methylase/3-demethylubiquinol 3-O-methyltransferase UbiG [Acidocella sp.]|nr:bifunctional 2-polyprenyl-6-hydroxyphenol methylase/3-demethylubiquinol 3-O-methyltransferase UbiG [Acidocella sp.]
MQHGSVIQEEITRFEGLAARWWDPNGPMRPLHMMNAPRAAWVAERVKRNLGPGVEILDVGCGAGLLSEALAREGFDVLGLDAGAEIIEVARGHAAGQELNLAYRNGTAEELVAEGLKFPVVTALEVIEHVADPEAFLRSLAALLEPEGLLFLSTLNRTPQSFLTAKVGAEYVLRLLPAGTHDWKKFITPVELGQLCRAAGLRLAETAGLSFSPAAREFRVSRNLSVNYLALAVAG